MAAPHSLRRRLCSFFLLVHGGVGLLSHAVQHLQAGAATHPAYIKYSVTHHFPKNKYSDKILFRA